MIKLIKIISWVLLGFSVIGFLILIILLNKDVGQFSPIVNAMHDGLCTATKYCFVGKTITSYQFYMIINKIIIPQVIILSVVLYSLYKKSKTAYSISIILFVFLFMSNVGNGHNVFTILVMAILLLAKPVRNYFRY